MAQDAVKSGLYPPELVLRRMKQVYGITIPLSALMGGPAKPGGKRETVTPKEQAELEAKALAGDTEALDRLIDLGLIK